MTPRTLNRMVWVTVTAAVLGLWHSSAVATATCGESQWSGDAAWDVIWPEDD